MTSQPLVLVVEAEPSRQLMMCACLMLKKLTPRRAGSVDAALAILGSERVDAVVLSAQIPDALNLLMFLRATTEYAHVPVLMFTDLALSPDEAEIAERNRADIFQPCHEHILIDRLGEMFDASTVTLDFSDDERGGNGQAGSKRLRHTSAHTRQFDVTSGS